MNPINKRILLLLTLCSLSLLTYSQVNEITIRFIGNCGLHLSDGTTNIYTDFPYRSGAYNYMEYEDSEIENLEQNSIFLFTHKHADHYSGKIMKEVLKQKNGVKYGPWNLAALNNLSDLIPDFQIQAFKTKHFLSAKHHSYLITWHGKKIYLSGDTNTEATIKSMKGLDWAFLPAWLVQRTWEDDLIIDAKMMGIYHIGPKDNINIKGPQFLMLDKQGEVIRVSY